MNVVEPSPAPYHVPIRAYSAAYVVRLTAAPLQTRKPDGALFWANATIMDGCIDSERVNDTGIEIFPDPSNWAEPVAAPVIEIVRAVVNRSAAAAVPLR